MVLMGSAIGAHASSYTVTFGGSDTGSITLVGDAAGTDAGSVYLASGSRTIDGKSVTLVVPTGSPSFASE